MKTYLALTNKLTTPQTYQSTPLSMFVADAVMMIMIFVTIFSVLS